MSRPPQIVAGIVLAILAMVVPLGAVPVISEFMASNKTTLADGDGDYSDWIEVRNLGMEGIDLGGYALTDDSGQPRKWVFPSVVLGPGAEVVVYASGKDRRPEGGGELHTNFSLAAEGEFLALVAPDGVTYLTRFAPAFPPQFEDESFGMGIDGTVTETDLTPDGWVFETNFAALRIGGFGTAATHPTLMNFDRGTAQVFTQVYPWLDFGGKLGQVPAGQTLLEATFRWELQVAETVVDAPGPAVPARLGVFGVPTPDRGVDAIAVNNPLAGDEIVEYYAAHTPEASFLAVPATGVDVPVTLDLTGLVAGWLADPGMAQRGEIMLLHDDNPAHLLWKYDLQGGGRVPDGLSLVVRTTDAASLDLVPLYFAAPTPGAPETGGVPPGPVFGEVTETTVEPAGGDIVVTAEVAPFSQPVGTVRMFYRYMFGAETMVGMADDGVGPDEVAGDGRFTATVPGAAGPNVGPGKMVRWRFVAEDTAARTTRTPAFRDPADSHEYFGTVWADPSIETLLPVVHWFTSNPTGAEGGGSRGALYHLGEFYDNIFVNRHGQSSGGFPKKSFNIDLNGTQRFRWDPAGEAPRVRDIDLLTHWGDKSKTRHVLGYEVMRMSGVAAHFAYPVRVQQNGTFHSVADFVEDADERYLERAGLNPEGVLYKAYDNTLNKSAGDSANQGFEKKTRKEEPNTDLQAFINGLDLRGTALRQYLYDNVDLAACINLMAANSVIRNTDMHRKNWYIYQDKGGTDEWRLLPWDLDLSQGRKWNSTDRYFDNALYAFDYVDGGNGDAILLVRFLYNRETGRAAFPELREMMLRRLRTLHDEFLQPPGTPYGDRYFEGRLDDMLALIDPPSIDPSDARLDFVKWGSWIQSGGGIVSYTNPHPDIEDMAEAVARYKNEYLPARRTEVYNNETVGNGGPIPPAQTVAPGDLAIGDIEFAPASGNQDEEYLQIVNNSGDAIDISFWQLDEAVEFTFPGGTVIPSRSTLYVSPDKKAFRGRATSPKGGEMRLLTGPYSGHLSSLGETVRLFDAEGAEHLVTTFVGAPTDAQLYLRVSELHYHPAGHADAEFIELVNTSADVTLDLEGVRIVDGVTFDFTGSAVTSLAPGEHVLVVLSTAAFEAAYGTAVSSRIAGEFADGSRLSNGGETIDIEDAEGGTVVKFTYNDSGSWPASADGGGTSLVFSGITDPDADPDLPGLWRAGAATGGHPGGDDHATFVGDALGDDDTDGIPNIVEWAINGTLTDATLPEATLETHVVGGIPDTYFTFRCRVHVAASGVSVGARAGTVPGTADPGALVHVGSEIHGDGTATVTYRASLPDSGGGARFGWLSVSYDAP